MKTVISTLEGMYRACSPMGTKQAPASPHREEGACVMEKKADFAVRRCYLRREADREKLVAAKGEYELQIAQAHFGISDLIFNLEIWQQYPELRGKKSIVYDDWSIGTEEPGPQTADLFGRAEPDLLPQAA